MPDRDIGALYDEVRERALKLIEEPFEEVYDDVAARSFRTDKIEINEVKSQAEGHVLSVYVANERGEVSATAYSREQVPGIREPRIKCNLGKLRKALDIMRSMMVLDDLANA